MLHGKHTLLKTALAAITLFSILGGTAWSQRPPRPNENEEGPRPVPRKKEKGPRALAVIEIAPNGKAARLVPITILVGDKWYDAGLYMATPVPMALDSQTVYEGETAGEPAGLFTVNAAQQIGDNWFGMGTWKPKGSEAPKKTAAAKPTVSSDDDERPVLRRPGNSSSASSKPSTPPATTNPTPAGQSSTSPAANAPTTEQKAADAKPAAQPTAPTPEENAARPTLRRGAPGVEQAESIPFPTSAAASKPATGAKPGAMGKPGDSPPQPVFKMIAAISDAGGPEPRSYVFHTNPGEREEYTRQMIELASKSLQKFVASRSKGVQAPTVTAANSRLDIFDISSNNEPVLVLTVRIPASEATAAKTAAAKTGTSATKTRKPPQPATAPAANVSGVEYDATIVARVAVTGELRKLFESVTDSTRLDAYPKLDLIDAVDANGDMVGELLFRETYDRGRAYVLYHVGMDRLWPLFESSQR